jgi:dolichol-phosphate mannosyltransferase
VISVVLPAFDEATTIGDTVRRLAALETSDERSYQILLVDDGSTDGTADRARAAAADRIPLSVIRHPVNRGLGGAIRSGLYRCLESADDADVIAMLDADDTHPPELLPRMVALVEGGADVVIASRYQPGAEIVGVPAARRALSAIGRWLFRLTFPISGVRDYTCGYRCYGVGALRRARQIYGDDLCTEPGFEATVDLLLKLRQAGISAAEVPLRLEYTHRVGASKMKVWRTIRRTLWLIARRLVERFTTYRPRRVRSLLEARRGEVAQ